MRVQLRTALALAAAALLAAGCGDDDDSTATAGDEPAQTQTAPVTPDEAAAVDLNGQETAFDITPEFQTNLDAADLQIEAIAPAKDTTDGYTLPIQTGRMDLEGLDGTAAHRGGLAIRSGDGESVELRDIFIDTRAGTLFADVGGTRVKFLAIDNSSVKTEKQDGELVATGLKAKLTQDAASLLREELGGDFTAQMDVADLSLRLVPILPEAAGAPE